MAIIIHRNDENNPGDYWSRPNHYFNIGEEVLDIKDLKPFVTDKTIVLGGGGLLGRPKWHDTIKELTYKNKVILWGAGHNNYPDNTKKSLLVGTTQLSKLPSYMNHFKMVGLRDFGLGYTWVPCASCMHPAFDTAINTSAEIIKRIPDFPNLMDKANYALQLMAEGKLNISPTNNKRLELEQLRLKNFRNT